MHIFEKKKIALTSLVAIGFFFISAQQIPFWSQHRGSLFLFNPSVAGSRKLLDARLGYRNQWVGYDGAPKSMMMAIHGKFFKDNLGFGLVLLQDEIGPFKNTTASGAAAYHLRFEESKLSIGVGAGYTQLGYFSNRISTQYKQDPAVNYNLNETTGNLNLNTGLLFYNDKFYFGVSVNNLSSSRYEFYKSDTARKAAFSEVLHYNFAVGYNWQVDNSLIWENSLMTNYVTNTPLSIDYTLRFHIKESLILGAGYRYKSAVTFHLGYTLFNTYQISYSYDLNINNLNMTNTGSHEIKLIFSSNLFQSDKKNKNKEFARQHFQYLF